MCAVPSPQDSRPTRKGSGKTRTEARNKLKQVLRDQDGGLPAESGTLTVADTVNDWLRYGLTGRSKGTVDKYTILCRFHVIPALGARKLRELTATDVDRWLAEKAKTLSTRTLRDLHACLNRSVSRAMARDKVRRNVVALAGVPSGQDGRPSKSLSFAEATDVLRAAEGSRLAAYVSADRRSDRATSGVDLEARRRAAHSAVG